MALATVTGYLKDVGLVSLGNRAPELVFEIDEDLVTAGSGTLIPDEPIIVIPGSDGSFSVDLHPSAETNPYAPYKLTVNWQSKGVNRSITPKWRIFVPAGGGTIADMIAIVTPNKVITKGDKGDAGNVLQQAAIDSIIAKNVTQDTRLDGVESKNTTQDTRLTAVEGKNTTQDARLTTVEAKNTTQDTRLDTAEAKNAQQDARLDDLPNQYIPLSRGTLPNGTDFNTLTGPQAVGAWGLLSSNTYPNAPAFTSTAVLEVQRGSGTALSVVHRVTFGAESVWREAVDAASGTWSAWVHAETTERADALNLVQDRRLTALESVAPKVSNIALDADGSPYYKPGSTEVHIIQDPDGVPYFITFLQASADVDGTPYF